MARKIINTNRKPQTWKITVKVNGGPQRIRIISGNAKKPYSLYTNRFNTVKNESTFYVRMPQTADSTFLEVYNEKNGRKPDGKDTSFKISKFEILPLQTDYSVFDYNAKSKSFIAFLQWFSENAAILSAGQSIYRSPDGVFRIDYLDNIRDNRKFVRNPQTGEAMPNKNFGRVLKTPARINRKTGVIEVSRDLFIKYTVPMRMIVLLHEIAHFYLNHVDTDEIESDLNALKIYLGLGYPRIEAHQAFTQIFYNADTPLNRQRYSQIKSFIEGFERRQRMKGINH